MDELFKEKFQKFGNKFLNNIYSKDQINLVKTDNMFEFFIRLIDQKHFGEFTLYNFNISKLINEELYQIQLSKQLINKNQNKLYYLYQLTSTKDQLNETLMNLFELDMLNLIKCKVAIRGLDSEK